MQPPAGVLIGFCGVVTLFTTIKTLTSHGRLSSLFKIVQLSGFDRPYATMDTVILEVLPRMRPQIEHG